ncbi:hypothetical protein EKI60_05110 [Candidatus Saccharibacteria bacterium]|nr:MAG: hypothetical protein EKI60_05110 [Candidatus Saccharibacteria bacterium]
MVSLGGFNANTAGITISLTNLKITAYGEYAIRFFRASVNLESVEVDGTGALKGTVSGTDLAGIDIDNNVAGNDITLNANDVYIHGIDGATNSGETIRAFGVTQRAGATITANFSNTTVSDIHNSDGSVAGFFVQALGQGSGEAIVNASIVNTTIHDLSATSGVYAFGAIGQASSDNATINTSIVNATVTGVRGAASPFSDLSAGVFSAGLSTLTSLASVHTTIQNTILADNLSDGVPNNCLSGSLNAILSLNGPVDATLTSLGHNLSDDASCTGFNQAGDKQNVSNIISTLGALQNNGGSVPTRALLPGSPAISAGGAVLGVTTDARGVARPGDCPSVGAFQFEGAVCGASTPSTSGSGNAAAPNTGANPASPVSSLLASFAGLLTLGYVFTRKRA